jgi:regulator of protease activity HflC (stomatin/prohibitin superfamily)
MARKNVKTWLFGVLIVLGILLTMWVGNTALSLLSSPNDMGVVSGILILAALATIWFYVITRIRKRITGEGTVKKIVVLLAIAIIGLGSTACTRISPGHVGVVVNQWGSEKGVSDYTARTGTIGYNPITTSVFNYPTYMQNVVWTRSLSEGNPLNEEITFTIKGNMAISVDVSLAYQLDGAKVPHFYVQFRSDDLATFTHGFLHNVTRDCFNELGGRYELDQIMGDNAEFILAVRTELQKRVGKYGVLIEQFGIIGAPRPPDAVKTAIDAKIGATQLAVQKQNEIMQAEADAKKAIATAEGQAQARIKQAEGEAIANERLTRSLSPMLLQWRQLQIQADSINKWNGQMPQFTGGALPFIQVPQQGQQK